MVIREILLGVGQHVLGILHVNVGLVIIAHHTDGILPNGSLLIIDVAVDFVDNNRCIVCRSCCDTSNGNVGLFCQKIASFIVVQQSEIIVAHKATGMVV